MPIKVGATPAEAVVATTPAEVVAAATPAEFVDSSTPSPHADTSVPVIDDQYYHNDERKKALASCKEVTLSLVARRSTSTIVISLWEAMNAFIHVQHAWGRSREFNITTCSLGLPERAAADVDDEEEDQGDDTLVHGRRKRKKVFITTIGKSLQCRGRGQARVREGLGKPRRHLLGGFPSSNALSNGLPVHKATSFETEPARERETREKLKKECYPA
ncbi:hypothetical protein BDZ89DRAFT_1041495 [Hymenopellis radicata]|nr:hypothetical protein BDZ89DRAFT_1041495 [Hymenopellis radicata]